VSLFLLFFELVKVKKSNKTQDIIVSVIYIFGIIYFYTLFISLVLSFLNIKNTLLVFSIVYLISFFLIHLYSKEKYIQKYYLNKKELLSLFVIIITCLTIGIIRYSKNFNYINYEIGDSAVHYKMSLEYSKYEKVFFKYHKKNTTINYKNSMFGFYVPCGIFMKIMPYSSIVSYNLFYTLVLCMIACCFYITLLKIKKNKDGNVFQLFLTLLYTLAYPLNYMFYGFGYLGIGIISINLLIMTYLFMQEYKNKLICILLFVFNFGLFSSYYLFVPVVYLSEFIYLLYFFRKEKYDFKNILGMIIFCLFIPSIFGYTFFISYSSIQLNLHNYSIIGESYQDFIGNFILLIPLLIYSVYKQAKSNNCDFDFVFLIVLFLYIIFTFILVGTGLISSYYYYKSYYVLWLIVNLFMYKLVNYKECKVILNIQYIFIFIVVFFSFLDIEKDVNNVNKDFKYSGTFSKLSDIYIYNKKILLNPKINITPSRLELIESVSKFSNRCSFKNNAIELPYISSVYYHKYWYYTLLEYLPRKKYENYLQTYGVDFSNNIYTIDFSLIDKLGVNDYIINDSNYAAFLEYDDLKCIVVDNDALGDLKEYDFNNDYDILFENKSGKLYKKKT